MEERNGGGASRGRGVFAESSRAAWRDAGGTDVWVPCIDLRGTRRGDEPSLANFLTLAL